jgi:integrase
MPAKHQSGGIAERSGSFYLRYYVTHIKDGNPWRHRVAEFLCYKDDRHRTASSKAVKDLAAKRMAEVNSMDPARENPSDALVADFWEKTYLPWCEKNLRASSVHGYKKLWKSVLKPHFAGRTLQQYKTADGSKLLTSLAERMGRNSLSHVRGLSSAMFSHAVNLGLIERNCWREVRVLAKPKPSGPTHAYSLEEAAAILKALSPRADAQAVFSLCLFLGLRPSEAAALQWGDVDFDAGVLHIRRGVVHGRVDDLKTEGSKADLLLIEPVRSLLLRWQEMAFRSAPASRHIVAGGVAERLRGDWCFPNRRGGPCNIPSLCNSVIKPLLLAAKVPWHGLYSARRGNGTILTRLMGNATGAQAVLRHASIHTTETFYVKATSEAGATGLRLLEAHVAGTNSGTEQD